MRHTESEDGARGGPLGVLALRVVAAGVTGALIGAVIGAGTAFIQPHVLGLPWTLLVNSASPWLLGGFIAGALHTRRNPAILSGLVTLVVEVAAYFLAAYLGHIPVLWNHTTFWMACALAGGPVAGLAGWAWRRGGPRAQGFGAAFLPGSFLAEAFGAYGLRLHYPPGITMFVVIGVLLLALMAWPRSGLGLIATPARGPVILAWTAAFAIGGILVYGPLLNAVVGIYSGGVYLP